MSLILDLVRAVVDPNKIIEERDKAVLDYADAECRYLQANDHKRKLHQQLGAVSLLLEEARAENIALEAVLAMHSDETADVAARREAWMAWSERLVTKANEQADLAGKRVLALESWVALQGGDRDVIYVGAGLEPVSNASTLGRAGAVVTVDEDES